MQVYYKIIMACICVLQFQDTPMDHSSHLSMQEVKGVEPREDGLVVLLIWTSHKVRQSKMI